LLLKPRKFFDSLRLFAKKLCVLCGKKTQKPDENEISIRKMKIKNIPPEVWSKLFFLQTQKLYTFVYCLKQKVIRMKKTFLIILLPFMVLSVSAQYADRWKKIDDLAKKQLPESALKEVESIFQEAQKAENFNQTVKAFIYKMRFTLEKNPDEASQIIKDFEDFAGKYKQAEQKALLHSMTAELYYMYYSNDQWTINRRSQLIGFIPDDMKEWSKNLFFDKISEELKLSLNNADALQNADVKQFKELLNEGENSQELQPTLYDFLVYRAISILGQLSDAAIIKNPLNDKMYFLPANEFATVQLDAVYNESAESQIVEIYQSLIAFHNRTNDIPALVYADLSRLDFVRNKSEHLQSGELYSMALEDLYKKYPANDAIIPVMEKMAEYYLSQSQMTEEDENNYRKTAYDIAQKGIDQFLSNIKTNALKNIQARIKQKTISANYNKVTSPASEFTFKITSSNVTNLELKIYLVNATAKEYELFQRNKKYEQTTYPNRTLIETKEINIAPNENFDATKNELKITTGTYGIYEFSISEKGSRDMEEQAHGTFTVTDFTYIQRSIAEKEINTYVLHRIIGQAVGNVAVNIFSYSWSGGQNKLNQVAQKKTDNNGLFSLNTNQYGLVYFFEKGEDKYFCSSSNAYYRKDSEPNDNIKVSLFTDRSLYRPGQTVYFKGIVYSSQQQKVIEKQTYEVRLRDANYQEVSKKSFTTNEFGSFAGEFVLPSSGLNGQYRLETPNGSVNFYVEEYKRPTFEVIIDKPGKEVHFGQQVSFEGTVKAYAGYTIPNAQVKYSIVRRTHRWWWWNYTPDKIVETGTVTSDENGKFIISFIPEKTNAKTSFYREQFYSYTLEANVTDSKGETQQGIQTVSVGDKSLFIISDAPENHDKQQELSIAVHTETINGKAITSTIQYTVYLLEDSDKYREQLNDKSDLKEKQLVLSGTFNTNDKTLKLSTQKWVSGQYKIVLTTPDAQKKEVKTESYIIIYGQKDKRPPVKSYVWMLTPKTECEVGENAEIYFGSSAKDVHLLYEIMRGNTILESRWISLNNEIKTFEIPFKTEYKDGVNVLFTFIKDEQLFSKNVQIKRKTEKKSLTPALSVFRDKLQPGETAQWTLTIPETKDGKHLAELMAGMYDASLDAIRPHSWSFNPSYNLYIPSSSNWRNSDFRSNYTNSYFEIKYQNTGTVKLNQLNWFGFSLGRYYSGMATGGSRPMMKSARESSANIEVVEDEVLAVEEIVLNEWGNEIRYTNPLDMAGDMSYAVILEGMLSENQEVQIRTNFNETAFFYPQLKTDSSGNVQITFTAPESLTRWNVKMLAHTADLYFGQAEAQAVTQKDLMVQLNMPRFVRRSDKLTLVANVINLTEKELTATIELALINPEDEQLIKLKNQPKTLTLKAGETKPAAWNITEFSAYDLVTVKVVAKAGQFSDGEQHYLPVLPDKVLLTESMPLIIRANQTRDFTFESLLKQGKDVDSKSLTVEFSANPTWYAVQALPTLSTPENNNAIDYFTAYYVNGLATHIANSNPKIKTVFEQWKRGGGTRDALLSNLEQNQELKNMLLEETPWVMAANNETEQKRQIALLFDLNQQANNGQQYLDKLLKLQKSSGGFAWFDGMTESRYITQTIILNMARYAKMTSPNPSKTSPQPPPKEGEQAEWVKKAIQYLDNQIARDYADLQKYNKNYKTEMTIGDMQWFYLHLRSEYKNIPIEKSAQEAVDYYTSQAEKYWTKATLYGKAATALICYRNGKVTLANDILKSLKENAMKTDELGMYWAKNTAGYFWNERPIGVQTAILEAFAEITAPSTPPKGELLDEMKIWLLKQKQTQRWDSPISTVDAIYALLNYGTDWLSSDSEVEIKLNNKLLEPKSKEAGTGYIKEVIPAKEIEPKMGNITIKSSPFGGVEGAGAGWGAMYWQYFQNIDKVQQHGGNLSVTKKLFVEKKENNKNVLVPVEQSTIKKGDKIIVRLVITTDCNLEFVALKDLRAACFEPVDQRSGFVWREGIGYYETTKDASTQFFFNFLPKGTYVFQYEVWANNSGDYADGMASIQCQYAPEFVSHSSGGRIVVE
jgi:hypothetical protein